MKKSSFLLCKFICALFSFFFINITCAQCIPSFGSASGFALYTVTGAVGITGTTTITGNIGTNAGAITDFVAPIVVNGTVYNGDYHTTNAISDLTLAYNELFNTIATNTIHAPSFGAGETITSGVYQIGSAGSVSGNLTLDGQGNPNAIFILKFGGAFTTGAGSSIILTNGTNPANVFWIAEGAIAMAGTTMYGTLIANNGAISIGAQGDLHGRMYSTTGAVAVYEATVTILGIETEAVVGGIISVDQTLCSGTTPSDLVLTGNSASVVKWQKANEPTFANPIDIISNASTLSGNAIGAVLETSYFRALVQNNGCANNTAFSSTCTIGIAATTWDGNSWSNGLPNSLKKVIIAGNYNFSENMLGCTMQITNGAIVTIASGYSLSLNGALTVELGSTLKMSTNSNLEQSSNSQNSGTIIVDSATSSLKRLDYVLWSSPVNGQYLQHFSPETLSNRFYSYNPFIDLYVAETSPSTTTFSAGAARLIRLPNNHPINPTVWHGVFTGIPNNGIVTVSVENDRYNAIGNPYPSGINANSFMLQNNITQPLYFWRKTNNTNNSSYAVYTTFGGISNSMGDPLNLTPEVIIPIGQGFLAKATSGTITFNNSMRANANNVPLLRSSTEKSRIWLNINSSAGFFS